MNNCIKVKIEGKNVLNYIKYLIKNKINVIDLNIVNHNELYFIIDYKYYYLLNKYSKTYKVTIIKKYGKLRLLSLIKNNVIMLSSLVLTIIFLYLLSNIIFSVDVMYNSKEVVDLMTKELAKYDIKKFKFKKNYDYLNQVKKNILNDNKDLLEWIEIEESGTKYIIRLVERKKEIKKEEYQYQSVISKKEAIITSIKASSGEKVKNVNAHVKKGDTIISGLITKPDGTNIYTKAKGIVYGEVWYKINIEYPLYYQEERVTGKNKDVLSFYFLNKKISIFSYKKYKQFKLTSNIILENNLIPFKIAKEKLYEVIIKEDIYTPESASEKAINYAIDKLKENNQNIIEIKDIQILEKQNKNSKIVLTIFASVEEDITKIIEIKEETKDLVE